MSTRTTVLWVPDWPVVAAVAAEELAAHLPAAVLDGARVTAVSALARAEGVRRGMRRREAQGVCPELVLLPTDEARDIRLFEPVAAAAETVVAGVEVVRAGLLLLPAGGAARYHGSEDALAERLVDAVAERTGHECAVGTADGLLAAVLAARTGEVVAPGRSRAFLAPRDVGELVHAATDDDAAARTLDLVDLLRRLGLRTLGALASLPEADVAARFGASGVRSHVLARGDDERPPARRRPEADLEVATDLEPPLDRVDQATFAGRRLAEELHDLLVHHGVTCGRLQIAARTDDGTDLVRTWRTDLGGWGGLTPARITDRVRWQLEGWLSASAVATARSHRAGAARAAGLRGRRREDLLPDALDVPEVPPVALVRLAVTALDVAAAGAEQGRLWGGPSGGDLRAHRALDRVQAAVGGTGLLTATLQGGRDVREQVHVRPWGEQSPPPRPLDRPWPGRLPDPAPATVCSPAEPVEVRDPAGAPVRVDVRTGLSGPPARVRWRPSEDSPHAVDERQVTGWAGPWLLSPRWWASDGTVGAGGAGSAHGAPRATGAGLRGHLQVAFDDGTAVLLACDAQGWTCEARYD